MPVSRRWARLATDSGYHLARRGEEYPDVPSAIFIQACQHIAAQRGLHFDYDATPERVQYRFTTAQQNTTHADTAEADNR